MISIVIPIYDEEESIPLLAEKVSAVIPLIKDDVEVLYINDGSSDMSQHKTPPSLLKLFKPIMLSSPVQGTYLDIP